MELSTAFLNCGPYSRPAWPWMFRADEFGCWACRAIARADMALARVLISVTQNGSPQRGDQAPMASWAQPGAALAVMFLFSCAERAIDSLTTIEACRSAGM